MESDMEVVKTAPDPYVARDKILALPVVIISSLTIKLQEGLRSGISVRQSTYVQLRRKRR